MSRSHCLLLAACCLLFFPNLAQTEEKWNGRSIMDEVFKRHEMFPYVFEEQTMILMDSTGNRDTREARRFSRVEKDKTVKYLLVFDSPAEIRGVALLAINQDSGRGESGIYLPAFGKELKSSAGKNSSSQFLGTDFTVDDLATDRLSDFRYVRAADSKIGKIDYFVVEAYPRDKEIANNTGYSMRLIFIRQDNFYIVRTDYFDRHERFLKRQTHHDLKRVNGDMWRANMILMENHKKKHKTLIKINRRVFSHDYVPPKIFTSAWLFENRHILSTEVYLFGDASRASTEEDKEPPDSTEDEAIEEQR